LTRGAARAKIAHTAKETTVENRTRSLSLLDEIKDIASQKAAAEAAKPPKPAEAAPAAGQPARRATATLNLELSKALADIHETVSRDAEREEQRRVQTLELERAVKEARERSLAHEQAQEIEVRMRAGGARRQAAEEERRLKVLRLEYEAALARGERVELPEELRPKPVPQVVAQLQAAAGRVAPPPPRRDPRLVWGGVAALVATVAAAAFFVHARLEAERLERERIERERVAELRRVQAEMAAAEARLQAELKAAREAAEAAKRAQLEATLAAQRAEEDRKRAEDESKKKPKGPAGKREESKKPVIKGINFTGF